MYMYVRSKHSAYISYSGPDHWLRRTEVYTQAVVSGVRCALPSPDLRQVQITPRKAHNACKKWSRIQISNPAKLKTFQLNSQGALLFSKSIYLSVFP